jgi:hypothetical protein
VPTTVPKFLDFLESVTREAFMRGVIRGLGPTDPSGGAPTSRPEGRRRWSGARPLIVNQTETKL